MKTAYYIYQFLFLFTSSVLFSQQGKILLVFDGDTTEYSINYESGPHPPGNLETIVDSGYIAIDMKIENDKWDEYKLTFSNYTSKLIDNFYIEIPDNKQSFDQIWDNEGGVSIPDLKGSEDSYKSYQLRFILDKPMDYGESWSCSIDIDYSNPSQFIGGFYIGNKLYKKTFTDSCQVAIKTSHIISWQPNTEQDLAGYRVYIGLVSGSYDQMFSSNTTEFDITFLGSGVFYIVVTAYDKAGNESGYSNEIRVEL